LLFAVVVALIAAVIAYRWLTATSGSGLASFDDKSVSPAQMAQLYAIANNETLAEGIGIGAAAANLPFAANSAALSEGGKPAIVFVSSDLCPFCAITRWGLIIALMRFGNFTSLHYMTSGADDVYPNTATFTFYNSSYSSSLVYFMSVETATNDGAPLQAMNAVENATFNRYDLDNAASPGHGSIPFLDIANHSAQVGASITPEVIKGMDWAQVISMLSNSSSPVAQAIIGNANVFTAYICASNSSLRNTAACGQGYVQRIISLG
jgi:hypothetical protein